MDGFLDKRYLSKVMYIYENKVDSLFVLIM